MRDIKFDSEYLPPLGSHASARDIVQTIALAMKNGYTADEILADNSPIVERLWAEARTERRLAEGAGAGTKTLTDDQIDRIAENCAKAMPGGIQGFCNTWGWRQFARELLDICAGHERARPAAQHLTRDDTEHGVEYVRASEVADMEARLRVAQGLANALRYAIARGHLALDPFAEESAMLAIAAWKDANK